MIYDLLVKNGTLYLDGKWVKNNLAILKEHIAYIGDEVVESKNVLDVTGLKVIPGLIDPHVHFELDCGQITSRDTFLSGSRCAAFGGVTTIVDFLEPTRNAKELERSYYDRLAQAQKSIVDYHFHACIREPNGDLEEYVKKVVELGMRTIKLFTTYSDTHRRTYDKDIRKLLELSKKYNVMILAHIENDELIDIRKEYTYKDLAVSRPSLAETSEALKLAQMVRETGGNFYMVHCSSGETLKALKEQFSDILGKNFFIESCPQYFVFNNSVLQDDENGRLFTFAPPLRSERERQLLVANYKDIDAIGTDHCAFTEDDKHHESLVGMPLGVGGIEHSFSIMYRRFGDEIIDKMSKNNAKLQGFCYKGEIKVGNDADLAIFEDCDWKIFADHSNAGYSIYRDLLGGADFKHVLVRGQFVLLNGHVVGHKGKMIFCGEEE